MGKAILIGGRFRGQWRAIQDRPLLELAVIADLPLTNASTVTAAEVTTERAVYVRHDIDFGTESRTIYVSSDTKLVVAFDMLVGAYSAIVPER